MLGPSIPRLIVEGVRILDFGDGSPSLLPQHGDMFCSLSEGFSSRQPFNKSRLLILLAVSSGVSLTLGCDGKAPSSPAATGGGAAGGSHASGGVFTAGGRSAGQQAGGATASGGASQLSGGGSPIGMGGTVVA
ncbi:MAG TPA: hypothetical protein VIV60_36395, partial [Polyangiaceae bacterium]